LTVVDNITDQSNQITRIVLSDGSTADVTLQFQGATERWTMNVSRGTFVANGINVCNSPNLLRDFRRIIPFGIACVTATGQDPTNVEDFVNGNAVLVSLDEADVVAVEDTVYGGNLQ
jgi:hypothetical protein